MKYNIYFMQKSILSVVDQIQSVIMSKTHFVFYEYIYGYIYICEMLLITSGSIHLNHLQHAQGEEDGNGWFHSIHCMFWVYQGKKWGLGHHKDFMGW